MKYEFVRSETVDTELWESIMQQQKKAIEWLQSGDAKEEEVIDYIKEIIKSAKPIKRDDSMLFWGFDEPENMPGDSKVLYFYMPTYYTVAFMIQAYLVMPQTLLKVNGFQEVFAKGLKGATGRGFQGSGYDREYNFIKTLKIFGEVKAAEFIQKYPELCPEFTKCLEDAMNEVSYILNHREAYESNGLRYMGEGIHYELYYELFRLLFAKEFKHYVFVYGTLMKGRVNHSRYLGAVEYMGKGILKDYALFDLGDYPGIKAYKGECVKGELYQVGGETIQALNVLECEGSLYGLKTVMVEIEERVWIKALVYVYLPDVRLGSYVDFDNQPWK